MLGHILPRTVFAPKKPMLRGLDGGRTQSGPMRELIDRADAIEERADSAILVISICAGFTAADIYDIGPSVTVTVDLNYGQNEADVLSKGLDLAENFLEYAWHNRAYTSVNHISIDDAVSLAKSEELSYPSGPPLILAEVTDNPGSGHYGDAVQLLSAMIGNEKCPGLKNAALYAIYDPEAVKMGIAIGEGKEGRVTLGGRHDPSAGGEPLNVFGRVIRITDGLCDAKGPMAAHVAPGGPSMLFQVGEVSVIVISNNGQALDVAQLEAFGCDFTKKTTVCLKSNHHFRASFQPLARKVVTVDGGGLGHLILVGGRYENVRRPIWPLDDVPLS
jgi:microcystin degradation protein MlrC